MASGFTDWLLSLGITGQTSGWLSNRPTYGAATLGSYAGNTSPSAWKTLITVSGKGIIYGGFVSVATAQSQSTDACNLVIDGTNFIGSSFTWYNTRGLTPRHIDVFYLIKYDDSNFIYVFGIQAGLTFESSLQVRYLETKGNTFSINCKLLYALIT